MYIMATPCEDFNKLRLLRSKYVKRASGVDPRPGPRGKKGVVTVQSLQIWAWVLKHNPECELIAENVKFDDMKSDWEAVCKALGNPLKLDAADVSNTRHVTAWWSNIPLPAEWMDLTAGYSPGDPNSCMDPGRTLEPYHVDWIVVRRPSISHP